MTEDSAIFRAVVDIDQITMTEVAPAPGAAGDSPPPGRVRRLICRFLDPKHPSARHWDVLVALSIALQCHLQVFMAFFQSADVAFWVLVYLCDFVNVVDIVVSFYKGYINEKGVVISEGALVRKRYMRTSFALDIISILPTDILAVVIPGAPWKILTLLRLNRLIRFYKIVYLLDTREAELGTNTAFLRTLKYTLMCLFVTHCMTCIWHAIACEGDHYGVTRVCYNGTWANNEGFSVGLDLSKSSSADAYMVSLYWAMATVTSTGYGDISAVSIPERWFSIFAMILGISVYFGMLLGGMTSMLTNTDQQRAAYVHRLETIKKQLEDKEISTDLIEQVMGYYEYLWVRKRGVLSEGIFDALPLTFQAEISHTTKSSILQKAPIFDGLGAGFLRMLSLNIKPMLYLPRQVIITRGDVGNSMYFIHRGEVEVLSEDDDDTPIATLKSGKLFGEVSLIYSLPRTATIRAKTHCDLMVLEKSDLHEMLTHYPEVSDRIHEVAKVRCTVADVENIKKEKELTSNYKAFQDRKTGYISPPSNLTVSKRHSIAPLSESSSAMHLGLKKDVHHQGIAISESVEVIRTNEDIYKMKSFHEYTTEHADEEVSHTSWLVENFHAFWNRVKDTTLDPHSYLSRIWEELVITVIFFNAFLHPYTACFTSLSFRHDYFESNLGEALLVISYILDFVLILDIFVSLRTGIPTPHGTLTHFSDIKKHYVKSVLFMVDVLAVLPIEIFCLVEAEYATRHRLFAFLRLNRLLKFFKVPRMFQRLEEMLDVSLLKLRTVKFILYIIIISHWMACCLFIVVCDGNACVDGSWFVARSASQGLLPNGSNPVSDYITSLYFASTTMTSTGYGDINANTPLGRLFSSLTMLVGLLLYGYCLAIMTATLANLDAPKVRFQEKLFAIKNFMKERHLGAALQTKVMNYLSMLWEKYRGEWLPGSRPLMYDMPLALQQDIAMEALQELLLNIPLFSKTDDSFLRQLTLRVVPYLFSPGDVIVYAGDMGREMYILTQGVCQIMSPDLNKVISEIRPGQYFGEIGMLFGDYRTASVQAKTHCEVLQLRMSDVLDSIHDFPILETQYQNVMNNREYLENLKKITAQRIQDTPESGSFKTLVQEAAKEQTKRNFSSERRLSYRLGDMAKFTGSTLEATEYEQALAEQKPVQRMLGKLLMRRTFLPRGRVVKAWSIMMVIICWINAVTVPLQASFLFQSVPLWTLHYIMDFFCLLNLYFGLHTAFYTDEGILVTHPLSTAKNYLQTNFIFDVFGCFPIEIFAYAAMPHFEPEALHLFAIVRLNRLLQLFRLPLAFGYFELNVEKQTGNIRQIKFFFYAIIFLNMLTCGVFFMACPPSFSDLGSVLTSSGHHCLPQSWLAQSGFTNFSSISTEYMYTVSLYWATATAVSVGYGDIGAFSNLEMVISLTFMIMGVLFFGYIIASVAASLANADAQRARYHEKLSAIKQYLSDQNIKQDLQERVINYYEYVWVRTRGVDPENIFDGLPLSLWGDVTLSLYEETISKISLFKDTETSFIKMLSKCIKPMLFLKGEYLVKKHDIGSEMFFIHRGAVDVVSEDGSVVFDTMRAGAAFGEVALLFQCPRTASIRARFNCDVFVLTKQDLDMALEFYPAIRDQIMRIAEERRQQARKRSATKIAPPPTPQPPPASSSHSASKKSGESTETLKPTASSTPTVVVEEAKEEEGNNENNSNNYDYDLDWVSLTEFNVNLNNPNEKKGEGEEPGEEAPPPSCAQRTWDRLLHANHFTISPDNKWGSAFFALMTILRVLSFWLITYECAFQDHSTAVVVLNYSIDVFFWIEIYIKFHLSQRDSFGDLVEDFQVVYKNYLQKPSGFAFDFVAAFPLEIFALCAPADLVWPVLSILRLTHMLRYVRMSQYFTDWQKELDVHMLMVRLLDNIVSTGLLIHIFSCLWYTVACPLSNCVEGSWVNQEGLTSILDTYCTSVYWCVATMTSTGYGDIHSYTTQEMLLSVLAMVMGKLMFGFVLGSIASTLANAEVQRVQYDMKLEAIKDNMADQHVPKTLRHRVVDYYDYLWARNKGVVIKPLFRDCPSCMMADVALSITDTMLSSIPILRTADDSFKRMISQRVNQVLFLPGDFIVCKGDMGKSVYYIHKGEVEVVTEEKPPKVTGVLHQGQLFGEVSLVYSVPRRVTVRARTHVDILTLSKQNLDEVLENYPCLAEAVAKDAEERFSHLVKSRNRLTSSTENSLSVPSQA